MNTFLFITILLYKMISIEKLIQQIQQCKDTSINLPQSSNSKYIQKNAIEIRKDELSFLNTNFKIHIHEELKISDKNVDMLQQIEKQLILNLDKKFIDNFNIEIKRIFDVDNDSYVYLYNIINMCKLYKISLPNEWTPVLNLHLKDIIVNYYNNLFEYTTSSLLINKLLDKIILLLYDNQIKFGFLCCDDTIIMALIKFIQPNTIFNIPDFCSVIRFELWENNLLRIYYDGLIIKEVMLP